MKILVTGGCSFSRSGFLETDYTWVDYLQKLKNFDSAVHTGLSAQGNDLISRKIIYTVTNLLDTVSPNELLVGIMWSGPNRHSAYLTDSPVNFTKMFPSHENPTNVVPNEYNWYILNPPNAPGIKQPDDHSHNYYKYFYNLTGSYIESCEHILRTQWFLQNNKIKYFMTNYNLNVLPNSLSNVKELAHLYKLIDFTNFLPYNGMLEWCKEHTSLPFSKPNDFHPSNLQHKQFVDEIIIPFLKEKEYI